MARQVTHLAYEVNSGKKDVSFLPYGFDPSLLNDEKRKEFKAFVEKAEHSVPEVAPDTKTEPVIKTTGERAQQP